MLALYRSIYTENAASAEYGIAAFQNIKLKTGPEIIKMFMLNSAEHEISKALKYQ